MRTLYALCPFMFVAVAALVNDVSVGTSLDDAQLQMVNGGAFTRCQDPGAPGGNSYVACNECYLKQRCDSATIATKCKAYTNPYACVQCQDGTQACTGKNWGFPLDGCAGPPTDLGACAHSIVLATFQTCTGQCP